MDSSTTALIFVAVLCGVAILYCLFRVCGGRITDLLACNFCRGPCCDCWGTGGRADARDFGVVDERFGYGNFQPQFLPPLSHLGRQEPPIVIVNQAQSDSSSSSSSSSESSDDEAVEGPRGRRGRRKRRERSGRKERQPSAIYSRRGDEYDDFRSEGSNSGGVTVV